MKTLIEVDIPAGRSVSEAIAAVKRAFDPDWMASWWHMSDIHCQANDGVNDEAEEITDDEARMVLHLLDRHSDSAVGINWDVIDAWIDHVKAQRKEVENA